MQQAEEHQIKAKDRTGYRGWTLGNVHTDGVVKCWHSKYSAAKLSMYPSPLVWPRLGDFNGAKALVDAVMNRDIVAVERLGSQFPEYDLGLGEWGKQLKTAYVAESANARRIIKKRLLPNGRLLTLECVTNGDTGKRSLVACFYRGRTRLSEKTFAQEPS